jgi:Domain of unknown function (DUF6431)
MDVKFWAAHPPEVARVRPASCPGCARAGAPLGGAVGLVGHGRRQRQLRGLAEPGASPAQRLLTVRRYRCRHCGAVVTVVPRGVAPRRHFSASTIGFAVALFGLAGVAARAVRQRVSDSTGLHWSWPALRRWVDAATTLWPSIRPSPEDATRRARAARAASTLASYALPGEADAGDLAALAFFGAARTAHGG